MLRYDIVTDTRGENEIHYVVQLRLSARGKLREKRVSGNFSSLYWAQCELEYLRDLARDYGSI